MENRTLVCVDIGNSRIKVAVAHDSAAGWRQLQIVAAPEELNLELPRKADWMVVSVNRSGLEALQRWVAKHRPHDRVTALEAGDFPLCLNVTQPERLGLDRLAAAFAASLLAARRGTPLIVINVGTAVTIDLLDAAGIFQGGVIYPGPHTCFQSLARATDQLPELFATAVPPEGWGKNTAEAIACGVWQMQVGAIREVVARYRRDLSNQDLSWTGEVFLSGGGAAPLERVFGAEFRYVPDLVLQGVRAAASRRKRT